MLNFECAVRFNISERNAERGGSTLADRGERVRAEFPFLGAQSSEDRLGLKGIREESL